VGVGQPVETLDRVAEKHVVRRAGLELVFVNERKHDARLERRGVGLVEALNRLTKLDLTRQPHLRKVLRPPLRSTLDERLHPPPDHSERRSHHQHDREAEQQLTLIRKADADAFEHRGIVPRSRDTNPE